MGRVVVDGGGGDGDSSSGSGGHEVGRRGASSLSGLSGAGSSSRAGFRKGEGCVDDEDEGFRISASSLFRREQRWMASASSPSTVSVPVVSRRARSPHEQLPAVVVPQRCPAGAVQPPPLRCGGSLAAMWRKIQGADDWAGLVEPLHPLLRAEVVRYGEFAMACYKAFDVDSRSRRYLACKYGKARLLRETGLGGAGYEVTRYVYATAPGDCGRWIGYVAVSSDEEARRLGRRDVLVAFRGTVTAAEWASNLKSSLTPAGLDPHDPRPGVEVESGFLSLYTSGDDGGCKFGHGSCREQLLNEVSRLIGKHEGEEMSVSVAGHSMGSALATLFGYDLAELGLNRFRLRREVPVTVYSFGGPRVGNAGFKERCDELGVKVLRVANAHDPVTKLPGLILNENWKVRPPWRCSWYVHVGVELAVDAFFKVENPVWVHDLGTYLGLLKGAGDKIALPAQKEMVLGLLVAQARKVIKNWAWPDVEALMRVVQCLRVLL